MKLDEKTGFWKDADGKIIAKDLGDGKAVLTDETGAVYKAPDPEEGISGGYYKDGVRIADAEGYLLDRNGERVTKGWVSKGWDWTKGKLKNIGSKLSPFKQRTEETFNETHNSTTNNSTDENYRNTDNHSENEKLHNNPPSNSSNTSIDDTKENVNLT